MLDASGSMFAPWENSIRMDIAKRILTEMVDSLRVDKNLQLALRVYGHQFHRKYQNCNDTKLEVPFRANNHDDIIYRLRQIQPQGVTPIANSLEQAANDFTINTGMWSSFLPMGLNLVVATPVLYPRHCRNAVFS